MPVTIHPSPHRANEFNPHTLFGDDAEPAANSLDLLTRSCPEEAKQVHKGNIIQSSFANITTESYVYSSSNGFIDTIVDAYNHHHHLKLRPDDVWFAILSQLNVYINQHAEALRELFVSHESNRFLEVSGEDEDIGGKSSAVCGGFQVDWGKFSYKMIQLLADNLKEPLLRHWILPSFTTTTKVDQTVAAVMMMSTFQKYFSYGCGLKCGLPSVTLLGERRDWEMLAAKATRLPTFGGEAKMWYEVLKPVLVRFVSSFDGPDAPETIDFWQKVAHHSGGGSGPTYLSGWITAFCFWGSDGKTFWKPGFDTYIGPTMQLDGIKYHSVETTDVVRGYASVPVKLDDNGSVSWTNMVAGLVGMRASSSGKELHLRPGNTGLDTLSVESGWCIYETDGEQGPTEPLSLMEEPVVSLSIEIA